MQDGFIKVAAGTPEIRVADCTHNAQQCLTLMRQAAEQGDARALCNLGYCYINVLDVDTVLDMYNNVRSRKSRHVVS